MSKIQEGQRVRLLENVEWCGVIVPAGAIGTIYFNDHAPWKTPGQRLPTDFQPCVKWDKRKVRKGWNCAIGFSGNDPLPSYLALAEDKRC